MLWKFLIAKDPTVRTLGKSGLRAYRAGKIEPFDVPSALRSRPKVCGPRFRPRTRNPAKAPLDREAHYGVRPSPEKTHATSKSLDAQQLLPGVDGTLIGHRPAERAGRFQRSEPAPPAPPASVGRRGERDGQEECYLGRETVVQGGIPYFLVDEDGHVIG